MPKSYENHKAQFAKLNVFVGQKSISCHYYIQNVKDGIEFRVYTIDKESATQFSQFISVKVKKILRKSQAYFWEKLRKLKLRRDAGFFKKKGVARAVVWTLRKQPSIKCFEQQVPLSFENDFLLQIDKSFQITLFIIDT